MDDTPFNVHEDYQVGDVSEVKEDRTVLPATSNVLVRTQKAAPRANEKSGVTSLNVQVQLVEGLELPELDAGGHPTGNLIKKYVGKTEFVEIPFKYDPAMRQEAMFTGKNRPFLVPYRQFLVALGYDPKNPPAIGDSWLSELVGKEFRADIQHRAIKRKNPVSGMKEATGEFRHEFRNFRQA